MKMHMLIPMLLVLLAWGATIWGLVKFFRAKGVKGVGPFGMAMGSLAIIVSLLTLIDYEGTREMHVGGLVAGAIIFGCGTIATVMAMNKE